MNEQEANFIFEESERLFMNFIITQLNTIGKADANLAVACCVFYLNDSHKYDSTTTELLIEELKNFKY